jgi:hypothetical protein
MQGIGAFLMKQQAEYVEGDQAIGNFERGMRAVFQVSKKKVEQRRKRQQQRKAATARKAKKADNGKV